MSVKDQCVHSDTGLCETCFKYEYQLARLNLVLEGYKLMAGLSTPDHLKVQRMIESQLATQTERVRVMREALELAIDAFEKFQPDEGSRYHDVWMEAEQALNQESLGDGK